MIQPKYIFNTKTPDHPTRLTVISPDALNDIKETKIPVKDIGGTASHEVEIKFPEGQLPNPLLGNADETDRIQETRRGEN